MEYLIFKNIKIPKLGFGSWLVGDDPLEKQKEIAAFEHGYKNHDMRLIDTAEMYGSGNSEKVVGEFLKGKNRSDFFIVDKILPSNAAQGLYEERCRNSLKIMGLDYFDLYLLHWKSNVDLQDMVDNMEHLKEIGLIKEWGVSNFDVDNMEQLFKCHNGNKCFANQCLFNLNARGVEYDLIPWCQRHDVLFMAYSPLGNNKADREKVTNNPEFKALADAYGYTPASLMLAFTIREDKVMAIFKTASINHLDENMYNVFKPIDNELYEKINKIFSKTVKKKRLETI